MDKDLDKILQRAKKGDPKPEPPKKPGKVFPKYKPYDYLVFTKLVRFSGFRPIHFLIIIPATMCIGFLLPGWFEVTIYTLIIYGCLVVMYVLVNQYRYRVKFKGWQERLPFYLKGWNEVIHEKKMFCDLCWNHARLQVVLTKDSPEVLELVQASLKLFVKKSEDAYYDIQTGSRSTHNRNHWQLMSPTTAEGSVNPEVMQFMKNLFENELSIIAKKTGLIRQVEVTLLSEEFQIEIQISGD